MPRTHPPMPLYAIGLAAIVAICWGLNYTATKFTLMHFPPFFCIFIRYCIVSLLLLPYARKRVLSFRQLGLLATLMITLHFALVFSGMALGLDIATTVVATQMGVPFSCVLGAMFLNDKLGAWRSFGMAIAFMGIVAIAGTPNVLAHPLGFSLAIIGTLAWAGSNIIMRTLGETPIMPLLFWTGLLSMPQTLAISLLTESDHWHLLMTVPWHSAIALCYSAVFSTIVGYGLWYWLLGRFPVSQVTPYSLLIPFSGFSAGIFFFDEHITTKLLLGGALTIFGVAIITIRRPRLAQDGTGS